MATEHAHEQAPLPPPHDGEFQRIAGIGPGIAQRLHAAGILTFRQLAALSPEEICAQLNGLVGMTPERIAHQDWPGKAEQLAQVIAAAEPTAEPEEPGKRQHYASFIIELLQDENYTVRRTRVSYIQKDEKESWAGWDIGRLDDWIKSQAAITMMPGANNNNPAERMGRSLANVLNLETGESHISVPSGEASARFLIEGQPFVIHLPLIVRAESIPLGQLHYKAVVQARPVSGPRAQVAEINGQLDPQGEFVLNIPVDGLEEGAYRLDASVLVYLEGSARPEKEGCTAFSEGQLIYVFSRETEAAA